MDKLPQPIAGYIDAANAHAPDRLAACFHPDAKVFDEGHVRSGRDQIAAWAAETGQRYQSTIEAAGLEEADGYHRLRATVRGNFPGSPISLHFNFVLSAGSIASLEIKP